MLDVLELSLTLVCHGGQVFAAREKNTSGISGQDLVDEITGPVAMYIPDQESIITRLKFELGMRDTEQNNDVVLLVLGAGDITRLGPALMDSL